MIGSNSAVCVNAENFKLKKEVDNLKKKLQEEVLKSEKLEQKVLMMEKTSESQRKELIFLQRQQQISDLRTVANCECGVESAKDCPNCFRLKQEIMELNSSCKESRGAVDKMNRLVNILRRKIVLLEASTLLSITKKDVESLFALPVT